GERELKQFYERYLQPGALIVNTSGGVDTKWDDTKKVNLTYCVSTAFGANYSAVVSAVEGAAAQWNAAANGTVRFIHMSGDDSVCWSADHTVVFDVVPTSGQPSLARSFFPNSPRASREFLIDASSFGAIAPYTLTGIARHELGHTLGFRHEHTRPEAGA